MSESRKEALLRDLRIGCGTAPPVRSPRGSDLHCRGWHQEAALRMLCNNLDPDNAARLLQRKREFRLPW
jgi:urocanate hydratase